MASHTRDAFRENGRSSIYSSHATSGSIPVASGNLIPSRGAMPHEHETVSSLPEQSRSRAKSYEALASLYRKLCHFDRSLTVATTSSSTGSTSSQATQSSTPTSTTPLDPLRDPLPFRTVIHLETLLSEIEAEYATSVEVDAQFRDDASGKRSFADKCISRFKAVCSAQSKMMTKYYTSSDKGTSLLCTFPSSAGGEGVSEGAIATQLSALATGEYEEQWDKQQNLSQLQQQQQQSQQPRPLAWLKIPSSSLDASTFDVPSTLPTLTTLGEERNELPSRTTTSSSITPSLARIVTASKSSLSSSSSSSLSSSSSSSNDTGGIGDGDVPSLLPYGCPGYPTSRSPAHGTVTSRSSFFSSAPASNTASTRTDFSSMWGDSVLVDGDNTTIDRPRLLTEDTMTASARAFINGETNLHVGDAGMGVPVLPLNLSFLLDDPRRTGIDTDAYGGDDETEELGEWGHDSLIDHTFDSDSSPAGSPVEAPTAPPLHQTSSPLSSSPTHPDQQHNSTDYKQDEGLRRRHLTDKPFPLTCSTTTTPPPIVTDIHSASSVQDTNNPSSSIPSAASSSSSTTSLPVFRPRISSLRSSDIAPLFRPIVPVANAPRHPRHSLVESALLASSSSSSSSRRDHTHRRHAPLRRTVEEPSVGLTGMRRSGKTDAIPPATSSVGMMTNDVEGERRFARSKSVGHERVGGERSDRSESRRWSGLDRGGVTERKKANEKKSIPAHEARKLLLSDDDSGISGAKTNKGASGGSSGGSGSGSGGTLSVEEHYRLQDELTRDMADMAEGLKSRVKGISKLLQTDKQVLEGIEEKMDESVTGIKQNTDSLKHQLWSGTFNCCGNLGLLVIAVGLFIATFIFMRIVPKW